MTPADLETTRRAIQLFALLNLPALMLNGFGYLDLKRLRASVGTTLWVLATFLVHFVLLDALILGLLLLIARSPATASASLVAAPVLFGLLHAYVFADRRVYGMFHFHVNLFVLRVLMQADAMKVLDFKKKDFIAIAAVIVGFMVGEGAVLYGIRAGMTWLGPESLLLAQIPGFYWKAGVGILAAAVVAEKAGHALAYYSGAFRVTGTARALPFYVSVTMDRFLSRCLTSEDERLRAAIRGATHRKAAPGSALAYPRRPIELAGNERRPDIVWIVLESLRPDALDPEVTPAVCALSEQSLRASRHLANGNGTRFGIFAMFSGLSPFYFDVFRDERRGVVLTDVLKRLGYETKLYASASLSFLGLKDSAFSDCIGGLEEDFSRRPADSDRMMTDRFSEWLKNRDTSNPFFSFLFYDSTHPRFSFPKEYARYQPFLEKLDSKNLVPANRPLLVNRYKNALCYVDDLVSEVLDALETRPDKRETVVMLTGDHGAEFWEHGNFTHSSAFTEEQVRVPLMLRAPGVEPRETGRLTSHLDLPATMFELLGVNAPVEDHSHGRSLLALEGRDWALMRGWANYCLIDDEAKIEFLLGNFGMSFVDVTDLQDHRVDDPKSVIASRSTKLLQAFAQFSDFFA